MKPYNELSDEEKRTIFKTTMPTLEQVIEYEKTDIESLFPLPAQGGSHDSKETPTIELKIGEKCLKVSQWEGEQAAEKAVDELLQAFVDTAKNPNDKDVIESAVFETQHRRGKLGPEGMAKLKALHERSSIHEADAQRESALKQIRRKISKTPKFRAIIYNGIKSYLTVKPSATNREIWESFPDGRENGQTIGDDVGHSVFRDGKTTYQVDSHGKAEKLRGIGPRTFDRYVTKARDELKIPTFQKKRRQ